MNSTHRLHNAIAFWAIVGFFLGGLIVALL